MPSCIVVGLLLWNRSAREMSNFWGSITVISRAPRSAALRIVVHVASRAAFATLGVDILLVVTLAVNLTMCQTRYAIERGSCGNGPWQHFSNSWNDFFCLSQLHERDDRDHLICSEQIMHEVELVFGNSLSAWEYLVKLDYSLRNMLFFCRRCKRGSSYAMSQDREVLDQGMWSSDPFDLVVAGFIRHICCSDSISKFSHMTIPSTSRSDGKQAQLSWDLLLLFWC